MKRRVEASNQPPPAPRPLLPAWLRYGVSLGLLGWVAMEMPWRELPRLAALDLRFAAAAVATAGAAYPLQAWRWQRLLSSQGVRVRPAQVHALFWVGNFYNSFLPGGIAGDGVRVAVLSRQYPDQVAGVVASVAADRLIGLAALLLLAVLALGSQLAVGGGAGELSLLLYASAGALVGAIGAALFAARWRSWDRPLGRWLGAGRAARLRRAGATLAADRRTLLSAAGLSVAVWLLDFAALWLLAQAVGLAAGALPLVVAAAASYVAAALPVSVGGHGIREGTLLIALGWLGVAADDPARLVLLALAFWCLNVGWGAAGGLALVVPRSPRAA